MHVWTTIRRLRASGAVIPRLGQFCPLGTLGGSVWGLFWLSQLQSYCWHLAAGSQGCCQLCFSVQAAHAPLPAAPGPEMSIGLRLRTPDLIGMETDGIWTS